MRNRIAIILLALGIAGFGLYFLSNPGSRNQGKIGGEAVTFFESHGNWEALCDAIPDSPHTARCYLRLVDVYSHRPDFGAYVGFVTIKDGNKSLELSLEPGSVLVDGGFRVVHSGAQVWQIDQNRCEENKCRLDNRALNEMTEAVAPGSRFQIEFVDRHGITWKRSLDGADYLAADDAFSNAAAALGPEKQNQ